VNYNNPHLFTAYYTLLKHIHQGYICFWDCSGSFKPEDNKTDEQKKLEKLQKENTKLNIKKRYFLSNVLLFFIRRIK